MSAFLDCMQLIICKFVYLYHVTTATALHFRSGSAAGSQCTRGPGADASVGSRPIPPGQQQPGSLAKVPRMRQSTKNLLLRAICENMSTRPCLTHYASVYVEGVTDLSLASGRSGSGNIDLCSKPDMVKGWCSCLGPTAGSRSKIIDRSSM